MARWEDTFWWPIEGNFFPVYNFCLEISTSTPEVLATGRLLFDTASTYSTIMFDDGSALRLVPVMTTSGNVSVPSRLLLPTITTGLAEVRKFLAISTVSGIVYISTAQEGP